MFRQALKGFRDVALLVARLALGVILVARGWHRWQVTGVDRQMEILSQYDLPAPQFLAWLTIVFELGGGILLIFGLATPLVGLGILLVNGGIVVLRRLDEGMLHVHQGGYEYHLTQAVFGLVLLAFGSGRLGADYLFVTPRERHDVVEEELPDGPQEPPPPPPAPKPSEKTVFDRGSTGNS